MGGLDGVRVLDFSSEIAGPYATKLLADAGADVVKVEKPSGDPMRRWSASEELGLRGEDGSGAGGSGGDAATAPPGEAEEDGEHSETAKPLFCYLNASKRSVFGEPQDEHIQRLLSAAHIVVEDFPPAESKKIDFAGKFPHLVVLSITPYGRDGPLADTPWTEFTVQAECGSISFRGRPDQPPIKAGGRVTEFTAGAYAAPAAVAALALAQKTGRGSHIDFSIAEAGIISLAIYSEVAQQLHREGAWGGPTRSVELPSIEPTKDGWVGFNTNTGQQAENFLMLIERFDLLESGEWTGPASAGKRMQNMDLWNSFVHEWTTKHTTAEIVAKAVDLRIPVAPVHSGETVLTEEHFLERGVFVENPAGFLQPRPAYLMEAAGEASGAGEAGGFGGDSGGGEVSESGRVEGTDRSARGISVPVQMRPAPKLGEHTEEVAQEWGGDGAGAREAPALFGKGDFADGVLLAGVSQSGTSQAGNSKAGVSQVGTSQAAASQSGTSQAGASQSVPLPFEGFRILDFTSWWAGPSATQIFSLMGAEVIHIESGTHPDGMRMTGAMFGQPEWWEWGHLFMSANTNKLGITLDLETPEGHDLLCRLIAQSDAVVENFAPRVAEKFGLSFEFLRGLNRRIVYMRMPAFGLSGPWRERVGFAQTMEQVTGMAWLTGHEYDQPRIIRGICDPIAGMHGAFALMLGLIERDRLDDAVFVEATMVEAALNCAAEAIVEFTAYGGQMSRMGNRSPYAAPQNLYACQGEEEWLAISVATDEQWVGLLEAIGGGVRAGSAVAGGAVANGAVAFDAQALDAAADGAETVDEKTMSGEASDGLTAALTDPKFREAAARRQAHDMIDEHLSAWAAGQDCAEAAERLRSHGVPAARVFNTRLLTQHPQFQARGFYEPVKHPFAGEPLLPTLPYRFTDRWIKRAAPTMGQDNQEVLAGLLGISEAEIATLEAKGVLATRPKGM